MEIPSPMESDAVTPGSARASRAGLSALAETNLLSFQIETRLKKSVATRRRNQHARARVLPEGEQTQTRSVLMWLRCSSAALSTPRERPPRRSPRRLVSCDNSCAVKKDTSARLGCRAKITNNTFGVICSGKRGKGSVCGFATFWVGGNEGSLRL
jgi:hypothetical protein